MKALCKVVLGGVVIVSGLWACGGDVYECPPGYVCTRVCSDGDGPFGSGDDSDCIVSDGGIGDGGWNGSDAIAPFDAGAGGGGNGAYPTGSAPASSASSTPLSFDVVDAEQSTALHRLVIVSDSPSNALIIVDPVTSVMQTIALPSAPVAVGLDPNVLDA